MKIWTNKRMPQYQKPKLDGRMKYDLHERENCRKVAAYEVKNVLYDFRAYPKYEAIVKGQKRRLLKYIATHNLPLAIRVSGPFMELRIKKETRPLRPI